MPTWLNVAEKPSVAKELANSLSNGNFRNGTTQSRFNPVFEFQFEGKSMIVTSVAGHLMEDEFPAHTRSWAAYPFQGLFSEPITKTVRGDLEPLKRNVEVLASRAEVLVLWLDCDREGENICFEVLEVAQRKNPRLQVRRAHFSSLTQRELLHAVRNLKAPDKRLSDAVAARQEMDLRIGAVFTRFQTVKVRSYLDDVPGVLSFGPCQFPTLGFVVRRYWQQQCFEPEDYYTLYLEHQDTKFSSRRGSVYDEVAATLLYDDMLTAAEEAGHEGCIREVQQRPTHRRPPVPLATVVLQKLASTHLRISSERCMSIAESLYQEGLISYPRTETDSHSLQDAELLDLVRLQTGTPCVADYANAMVASPTTLFRRPLRGTHDDKAHPPIHPTKAWAAVPDDEKGGLYTLIVRHFLASLSPDAVAATTRVTAEFGGEIFTTGGTTIVEQGWLNIFPYERWHSTCIPNYKVGETFVPTVAELRHGRTGPPPHLTETNLIALMDKNGIGTDATIAQHIKTIVERKYVKRDGQLLTPTTLGIALASAYEALGLLSLLQPQLRAQMELAMCDIANGAATKEQVVGAAVKLYEQIFSRLQSRSGAFLEELKKYLGSTADTSSPRTTVVSKSGFLPCGVCQRPMDLTEERGDRDWETWYARCSTCEQQHRLPSGRLNVLEPTNPAQFCPLCHFQVLQVTNREKQTTYFVCSYCFSHPPASLVDVESAGTAFRCFQCSADCPLAKGAEVVSITRCISCRAHDLRLRSNGTGHFLSCRGYPRCSLTVTLPTATSVKPCSTSRCPACDAVLLTFDFSGVTGVPGLNVVDTVCVSCDVRLKDYIIVKGLVSTPSAGATGAGPSAGTASTYTLPSIAAAARRGKRAVQDPAETAAVLCQCGVPARQLVSRKETSRGQKFFTCARRQCSFFQWIG